MYTQLFDIISRAVDKFQADEKVYSLLDNIPGLTTVAMKAILWQDDEIAMSAIECVGNITALEEQRFAELIFNEYINNKNLVNTLE